MFSHNCHTPSHLSYFSYLGRLCIRCNILLLRTTSQCCKLNNSFGQTIRQSANVLLESSFPSKMLSIWHESQHDELVTNISCERSITSTYSTRRTITNMPFHITAHNFFSASTIHSRTVESNDPIFNTFGSVPCR